MATVGEPLPVWCSACGSSSPPTARFCAQCGAAILRTPAGGAPPLPVYLPAPSYSRTPTPYYRSKERDRTISGLLLMAIGFALAWIPYINIVGGLLGLIGVIRVFLGRAGFSEEHHRYVVRGAVLIVITIVASIVLVLGFAAALVREANQPGLRISQVGNDLTADLGFLLVGGAILSGLGYIVLVYGLADRMTQRILFAGFVASAALSILILVFVLPLVDQAVTQATSGSLVALGPINSLQLTADLFGLTKIVPSLPFAWAYLRARDKATRLRDEPASEPRPSGHVA